MITDYDAEIAIAARNHGLDPRLLTALVLQESGGHADAFRYEPSVARWFHLRDGLCPRRAFSSYGLCQILYATATDYGFATEPEYLFLPTANLELGAHILSDHIAWAGGDVRKALMAYNAGRGNLPAGETYAARVLKRRDALG